MRHTGLATLLVTCICSEGFSTGDWPQFRGPNAAGIASGDQSLPAQIGPDQNVIWKTPLPSGHSSPAILGDRIYLTGVGDKKLWTFALDRTTGKLVWEAEAPHNELEPIHQIGSHAQSSPATDGEVVVSFFGSCGLFCYDIDGKLLWHRPFGPFKNEFGAGSSPILVDDRVILSQDHDTDSFLIAIDKWTGETIWRTDRSEFPRNYCTPVIWQWNGKRQIVVAATLRVVGYDFETGDEAWTVHGIARIVNMTPVVGPDGTLLVPAWTAGGDDTDRITAEPFEEMLGQFDADRNGTFEPREFPEGPLRQRFNLIDRDKDAHITRGEYEYMRNVFHTAKNVILAIRPGGSGDITDTHVAWQYRKLIPYCPSPVYADGYLFMVKDGGIAQCLDARSGQPTKQGRVSGNGPYYSSPVVGDGKVYMLSQRGELSVITAEPQWRPVHSANFDEDTYATPALVDGRIYLRTAGHLYCFGLDAAAR